MSIFKTLSCFLDLIVFLFFKFQCLGEILKNFIIFNKFPSSNSQLKKNFLIPEKSRPFRCPFLTFVEQCSILTFNSKDKIKLVPRQGQKQKLYFFRWWKKSSHRMLKPCYRKHMKQFPRVLFPLFLLFPSGFSVRKFFWNNWWSHV